MKILYNARIYTLNSSQPQATALVIDRDQIVAVGNEAELLAAYEGKRDLEDLGGRTVLPGLTDAHLHLETYALGLNYIDCETSTRDECLRRVGERSRSSPAGAWILGHGWNQNEWPEGFGSAADLDAIAPDPPVYLTAKSLHAAWANTAALRLAGLNDQSPNPVSGELGRDGQGRLNGILFESAMELVGAAIPEPGVAEAAQAIQAAQTHLWSLGLTGAHDFDRSRCFSALQLLHQSGKLRLRVIKSIPLENLPQAAQLGLRSGFGDDFLRIGSVKAFMDGALGPQTAAMIQPYEGSQDSRGLLMMDAEELTEHGRLAAQSGLSLAVHAIGDRANHEVLEAFQRLRQMEPNTGMPLRHRIEHVQLLHPADAHRLAELGVIASMQPIHATSDMRMADRHWGKRSELAYAWRTQLQHGARLVFGSDAPVENPNPWWGIHAAVTRQRLDGSPGPQGWYPEQRLSVMEAVQAYTLGPAYAASLEQRLGQLAPGYLADLLVLDQDPFTCEKEALAGIRPFKTMVGGEWVFEGG